MALDCDEVTICADTVAAPLPSATVRPGSTRAWLVRSSQVIAMAAATPTLPLPSPELLLDWLLPWLAAPPALAFEVPTPSAPLPEVFGLLATVSWLVWSVPLPESLLLLLPWALALAVDSSSAREAEVTARAPAVRSRASSALVLQPRTRGSSTTAPIDTSLPAASASPSEVTRSVWLAEMLTAPVVVVAAPAPSLATTVSPESS